MRLTPNLGPLLALVATLLSAGCTTTYHMSWPSPARPGADATSTLAGRDTFRDISVTRKEAAGEGVTLLYGSVGGRPRFEPALIPATDPAARAQGPALVAPPDVIGYEVKQHGLGAVEGLGIGLLTGVLAGALVGASLGDDATPVCTGDHCGSFTLSSGAKAMIGGGVGGYGGALLGTLIGAIVGHTNRVVF